MQSLLAGAMTSALGSPGPAGRRSAAALLGQALFSEQLHLCADNYMYHFLFVDWKNLPEVGDLLATT